MNRVQDDRCVMMFRGKLYEENKFYTDTQLEISRLIYFPNSLLQFDCGY